MGKKQELSDRLDRIEKVIDALVRLHDESPAKDKETQQILGHLEDLGYRLERLEKKNALLQLQAEGVIPTKAKAPKAKAPEAIVVEKAPFGSQEYRQVKIRGNCYIAGDRQRRLPYAVETALKEFRVSKSESEEYQTKGGVWWRFTKK